MKFALSNKSKVLVNARQLAAGANNLPEPAVMSWRCMTNDTYASMITTPYKCNRGQRIPGTWIKSIKRVISLKSLLYGFRCRHVKPNMRSTVFHSSIRADYSQGEKGKQCKGNVSFTLIQYKLHLQYIQLSCLQLYQHQQYRRKYTQ